MLCKWGYVSICLNASLSMSFSASVFGVCLRQVFLDIVNVEARNIFLPVQQ